MSIMKCKSPVFMSWWQGGDRYSENISKSGIELDLPLDSSNAVFASEIWNQLYYGIKLKNINFNKYFINKNNPLNLEIGIGNGEFLTNLALTNHNENWLGIEVFKKIFLKAKKKVESVTNKNIKIIQFDADLIVRIIPDNSLHSIYINFPDPWPKKGHNKRRLLKTPFIKLLVSKLQQNKLLHIATDHTDYANEIIENLKDITDLKSIYNTPYITDFTNYFSTKYYRKFAKENGGYLFRYIKS